METVTLLGVAVGLALDATAAAMGAAVLLGPLTPRQLFRLAWHFGLFQALMPVLGWAAGTTVEVHIRAWDHWVAFGLLSFVGGRAIWDALRPSEPDASSSASPDPSRGLTLVLLSIATSIDALAVGLGFAALGVSIWYPAAVIGVVTGAMTVVGATVGARAGARSGRGLQIIGGAILIVIGIKILIEHTM
jgi:putative Mn2+ efflux pump MntP